MLAYAPATETGAKDQRMQQRVTKETQHRIDEAANLLGVDRTDFMITASLEKAADTMRQHQLTVITADDQAAFLAACEATEATPGLVDVMTLHRSVVEG